jgi:hypothetical protein
MHFYPPRALCVVLQFLLLGAVVVTSSTNSPGLKDRRLTDPVIEPAPGAITIQPAQIQARPAAPTGSTEPEKRGRSTCSRSCERHLHAGAGRTTTG